MQFYVHSNGEQQGPFTPQQIRGYLSMGHFHETDLAWHEGLPEWKPLSEFSEFKVTKHRTPNYKAVKYTKLKTHKAKSHSSVGQYVVLGVVLIAAAGGGGYYWWHGQQKKKAEAAQQAAAAAAAAEAEARNRLPETLEEVNRWYEEPPVGQNAATFFQQGFDALRITDDDLKSYRLPLIGKGRLPTASGAALPGATKTAVAEFLERNQQAINLFQKGAECSGSRYPIDLTKGAATPVPYLPKVRQAAEIGELMALSQADSGNAPAAAQGVLLALASGRSLDSEPLLISQLVRVACQNIAVDALERVVNRIVLPSEALNQLQTAFAHAADYEAAGTGFTRGFVGERASGAAAFDRPGGQTGAAGGAPANLKDQQTFYRETLTQYLEARKEALPGRLKADDTITSRYTEAQSQGYTLILSMLPSLAKVTSREAAALARLRLAQTAVALERFRAENGNSYPNALEELTPKYLSEVPMDPFDGQPLRYRRAGEGYLLSSIGADLRDDSVMRQAGSDDILFAVLRPPKSS